MSALDFMERPSKTREPCIDMRKVLEDRSLCVVRFHLCPDGVKFQIFEVNAFRNSLFVAVESTAWSCRYGRILVLPSLSEFVFIG